MQHRRFVVSFLAAAIAAVGLSTAIPRSATAAVVAPYKAIVLDSSPYIGADAATHSLTIAGSTHNLVIDAMSGGSLEVRAALFSRDNVTALPTSGTVNLTAGGPLVLSYWNQGQGCDVVGTLTVRALTFVNGVPATFDADVSGTCNGVKATGQLRYGVDTAYGFVTSTAALNWPSVRLGERSLQDVVVTGHGPKPPTITSATLVDTAAPDGNYVVMYGGDKCSGVTLTDAGTCRVSLTAAPRSQNTPSPASVETTLASGTVLRTTLTTGSVAGSDKGGFHPISGRMIDTRSGLGAPKAPIGPGGVLTVKVTGRTGVPASGVSAVVLNVTVASPTTSSYLTVYPGGTAVPNVSNLNYVPGAARANLVTVPVSSAGTVSFRNAAGSAHVIVDALGYYDSGVTNTLGFDASSFFPVAPDRIFDSRRDWGVKLNSGEYFPVFMQFDGFADQRIRSFAVTLTSVNQSASGYLSATSSEPVNGATTSSLNYVKGVASANLVVVPRTDIYPDGGVGPVPGFWIANNGGATDVIVDVVGFYGTDEGADIGLRFNPITPQRILDTRTDLGAATVGTKVDTTIAAPASAAGADTLTLVGNATAVHPSLSTYLTFWDAGTRPFTSSVNALQGSITATATWTLLDWGNTYKVFNGAGTTDVLYDVSGQFNLFPASLGTMGNYPLSASTAASSVAPSADAARTQARLAAHAPATVQAESGRAEAMR